jgi:hypothetical protein
VANLLSPEQAERAKGSVGGNLLGVLATGKGVGTVQARRAMEMLALGDTKTARDKAERDERTEAKIQAVAMTMDPQAGAEYAARMRLMYGLGTPQAASATAALRPDAVKILGPQSMAIDPMTGETVAQAPTDVEDVRDYLGGKAKFKNGVFASWVLRPASERDASVGDALNAQREYQRVQGLRDDYANNPTIRRAADYASAYQGIVAASQSDDPQTSLAMMYEAVKMRDPNAVREGELALQRSARSVPQWMYGYWEKASKGNVLTPVEKRQILEWAKTKITEQDRIVRPIQSEFGAAARRFGVQADSSFIAPSPFRGTGLGESAPAGTPEKSMTKAEFDRLSPLAQKAATGAGYTILP